jgi:hypothetical protein
MLENKLGTLPKSGFPFACWKEMGFMIFCFGSGEKTGDRFSIYPSRNLIGSFEVVEFGLVRFPEMSIFTLQSC